MKVFKREHYTLRSYEDEKYRLDILDEDINIQSSEYSNKWEELYMKAKKLAKKGKTCEIWELRYEFD
jgi:hypothetical protein